VSFGLDVDCQEASSKTPCRAAQQQKTNTLPKGVLLDDFPGSAIQKREAERIFQEFANVFTREGGSWLYVHHASQNPHRG